MSCGQAPAQRQASRPAHVEVPPERQARRGLHEAPPQEAPAAAPCSSRGPPQGPEEAEPRPVEWQLVPHYEAVGARDGQGNAELLHLDRESE